MKVSILSPVYNEAKYLSLMIDSVRGQTHADLELLLVDDGSTDGTIGIIEMYGSLDSRIVQVGDSTKLGKVEAFNRAFARSTGDFVVLLGGDDVLPEDSIEQRIAALGACTDPQNRTVAFFRLRTMSDMKKFDGMIVPKVGRGNRSGGTILMSRGLAELVFPIDSALVSEDLWTGSVSGQLADKVVDSDSIVLNYRIHSGNSNPRHLAFSAMNESLHKRLMVYDRILATERLTMSEQVRQNYQTLASLEKLRYERRNWAIVRLRGVSVVTKLRTLSTSSPILYKLRSTFYRFFSGWS